MKIDLEDLLNKANKNHECWKDYKNIRRNGLLGEAKCFPKKISFDFELPYVNLHHQHNSYQCFLYAGFRMIKNKMAENMAVDVNSFDFSATYLDFFDKWEKIQKVYEKLESLSAISYVDILNIVDQEIGNYGTCYTFFQLLAKYGMVFTSSMPEVTVCYNANEMIELLRWKIKSDAVRYMKKTAFLSDILEEAFYFLCKVYGVPPKEFFFEGKCVTPVFFFQTYFPFDLSKFLTISVSDKEAFLDSYAYVPSPFLENRETILHLPLDKIIDGVVSQLDHHIGVWFSCEESLGVDYQKGIFRSSLQEIKDIYHIADLSCEEMMKLGIIQYDHAMCITGYQKDQNGNVTHFLVDNSFETGGLRNGQIVMPISSFERSILTVVLYQDFI